MPGLRDALWVKLVLLGLWVPTVAALTYSLERHEATPGAIGRTADQWPAGSKLRRSWVTPTLLLFAHPQCPCTRASLDELDGIASIGKIKIVVVLLKPSSRPLSWTHTDLWSHARRMPQTEVFEDTDGVECKRFGALTSGTAILFSAGGQELFRGGITPSRGHEGENAATDGIEDYLKHGASLPRSTPVYGCALFSSSGS